MIILWILLPILLIAILAMALYPKYRVATNFNLIYTRALRIEGNKQIAIIEALKHLRTLLTPFNQLSDLQIQTIARCFSDLKEPHKAIQHLLQHAEKNNDLQALIDNDLMESWKKNWQAKMEISEE